MEVEVRIVDRRVEVVCKNQAFLFLLMNHFQDDLWPDWMTNGPTVERFWDYLKIAVEQGYVTLTAAPERNNLTVDRVVRMVEQVAKVMRIESVNVSRTVVVGER